MQKILNMSTIEQLQGLSESEDHIEFKEAKRNYPFSGGKHTDPKDRRHCVLGYIAALANERGGRLVLGMADRVPHTVVGSNFAENKVGELVKMGNGGCFDPRIPEGCGLVDIAVFA